MDILCREIRKNLIKRIPKTRVQNDELMDIRQNLMDRIDTFISDVVMKLDNVTVENSLYFFEIYKEGLEAIKLTETEYHPIDFNEHSVRRIINLLKGLTLTEMSNLGLVYLSDCYTLLTGYLRNKVTKMRYDTIYSVSPPNEWIAKISSVTKEEMAEFVDQDVQEIIQNIKIITTTGI